MTAHADYRAISDYALIGNLRTAALVGRDASIDWCCLPEMDDPSVFAALLDARRGGRFAVLLDGARPGRQSYVGQTNVLLTALEAPDARVEVTDFMPLWGRLCVPADTRSAPEIHRVIKSSGARAARVAVEWSPRLDYARSSVRIDRITGGWRATDGRRSVTLLGVDEADVAAGEHGPVLTARFTLPPGRERAIVCRWGARAVTVSLDKSRGLLSRTLDAWLRWVQGEGEVPACEWAGKRAPMVKRSALALKLLSHADTGAIAAAPTTSLPEVLGGVRNWDYRYAWIRDASLTAQALISLGHVEEALGFLEWVEKVSARADRAGYELQIMYGLHGETDLPERDLAHLEGYRNSRPVRVGNAAAKQFQLEVYGELLTTAYELARRGRPLPPRVLSFLSSVASHVDLAWRRPDSGIWEMRAEPRHFTYSKVMAWVALERAVRLADHHGLPGDKARWRATMAEIHAEVLERAYDRTLGAFVQSYGFRTLDAANLRIGLLEFLPHDDYRVQGTIDRTLKDLVHDGFVYRYQTEDGLPGEEGAFGLCTFWLVDALALSGRVDEARELFDSIASRANHVGLLPEEFDPATGEFLGNFPQAFSHIGLVNSALYLAHAEGRRLPEHAPIGTPEHRRLHGHEPQAAPAPAQSLQSAPRKPETT